MSRAASEISPDDNDPTPSLSTDQADSPNPTSSSSSDKSGGESSKLKAYILHDLFRDVTYAEGTKYTVSTIVEDDVISTTPGLKEKLLEIHAQNAATAKEGARNNILLDVVFYKKGRFAETCQQVKLGVPAEMILEIKDGSIQYRDEIKEKIFLEERCFIKEAMQLRLERVNTRDVKAFQHRNLFPSKQTSQSQ